MNPKTMITAAVLALSLAACGGSHSAGPASHPATAHAASAAATASAPAGCQQAAMVTAAIRSHLHADPAATGLALRQLQNLGKSLPVATLRTDVDRAALDLALFRQYVLMGGPVVAAAKRFGADLNRITAECS